MSNIAFMTVLEYSARVKEPIDDGLLRHLIITKLLHTIAANKKESKDDIIVLAFDSKKYWRKEYFPNYKSQRKAARDGSSFDWDDFFPKYNKLKEELAEYFPYYCIEVDGAEADDIIAAIVMHVYGKDCLIASSDEDYLQLQEIYQLVKQYSIKRKSLINLTTHQYDLFEHIVRGDTSDGIPNILSSADSFVDGVRQKTLTTKKIDEWRKFDTDSGEFCDDAQILDRYIQNRKLIDMREMPQELRDEIVAKFNSIEPVKGRIFEFCKKYKLTKLMMDGKF